MIRGQVLGAKSAGLVVRNFKERQSKMRNMRGANLAAVARIEAWIKRNFGREGKMHDDATLYWPPLKESTIRRRRGGSDKPLQDTGRLLNSWRKTATNQAGKLISGVSYSSIHEKGNASKNIPQRKIFPKQRQGEDIAKPVYETWIRRNIVNV